MLSKIDAAYIAGFIDADGCITLRGRDSCGHTQSQVQIAQVKKDILIWIRDVTGLGRIYTSRREYKNSNHRQAYALYFFAKESRKLLPVIRPYLKAKAQQCDIVLEYFKLVDTHHTCSPGRTKKVDKLIRKIRALNRRGKR